MTREQEIEQQSFVYYETCSDEDIAKSKGFIEGAKWADQNPRKELWDSQKVLDWVKKTFSETDKRFNENYSDMLIKCLCKAMEE